MWQDLVKVLGKLAEAYERLIALARRKQGALIAVDMEALEQLLDEEKGLIDEIEHLEFGRQQVLSQLAKEVPDLRAAATMEEVGQYSPADLRPWLARRPVGVILRRFRENGFQSFSGLIPREAFVQADALE